MKKLNAYPVYLIYSGATSFFFALIFTINMVYQARTVGLNPLQLVLVGTLLETAVFIFEVPTGIVADVYSRRLSVIVGTALIGAGFVLEGLVPTFAAVLLTQVIWGLGATFISGAAEAWIADEVGQGRTAHVFLRGSQVGQLLGLVGIFFSVALASIDIRMPIVLGGGLFVALAVFLRVVMPEDGFTPRPAGERESWRAMAGTLREGIGLVRLRPVLVTILLITAIYGMFSEGVDRLWTPHVLDNFTLPVLGQMDAIVWFGIIRAVSMLLSLGTTEYVRRRLDLTDQRVVTRSLFVLFGLLMLGVLGFALSRSFALALAALWLADTVRETMWPIFTTWTNQHTDSSVRATVLSLSAQSNAVGQIAGGPVIGWIATVRSLRLALSLSALMLTPVLFLLRGGRAAPVAATEEPAA